MDNQGFAEFLNGSRDLTIGQILKLILKLKYRFITMFFGTFLAITGSAYFAGQASVEKNTAVMLQSPFSMRLVIDGAYVDFDRLTLLEDPALPSPTEDKIILSLREIRSAFDVVPVGKIVATISRKEVPVPWRWLFSEMEYGEAHANSHNPAFDWLGHQGDFDYQEKYIAENMVNRYYTDECVLEYMVDGERKSIPGSFRWIKTTH